MQYLPVLLTASVSTRGMVGACFSDEERYGMYLSTLSYYIDKFIIRKRLGAIKFVFTDNSGWNLNQMKEDLIKMYGQDVVEGNVEFISLAPEMFEISKGKGYNELLMINLTLDKSKFIKDAKAFLKVTGRYPVYNLSYFHRTVMKAFDNQLVFFCDVKDHKLYALLGLDWNSHSFEARLWASKVDFYKMFMAPEYVNCNDYTDNLVESVLFNKLNKATLGFEKNVIEEYKISFRFNREPSFGGLEGSESNTKAFSKNQQSFKGKLKRTIGNFFRIFLPWIKF